MLLLAVLFPLAASAVSVAPLPQSAYADTEVSTNIAFVVDRAMMTRIEFTVALDATPTNNVEIAFGADADEDGVLAPRETRLVVGWDCGAWFVRKGADGAILDRLVAQPYAYGTDAERA